MTLTYYERGILQGESQGERKALQRMALRLLETKFGSLSAAAKDRLATLSIALLEDLQVGLVKGQSLNELGLED